MTSQLIIVEGLPGSGKSTFSQAISIALARSGRAVRWYSELEAEHPLAHGYPTEDGGSVEAYFAACRSRWREFFEDQARAGERTVIVEAWFLQDLVFGLLLAGVERDAIVQGVTALWDLLPQATTTVVYLSKRDVSQALDDVRRARGERVTEFYVARNDESPFATSRDVRGTTGLVRFWSEHRAVCDAIVAGSSLRTVRRDVSGHDWTDATREVLSAFDLEVPWLDDANLSHFAGSYVLDERAGSTFEVVERAGRLCLARFPFFWRSGETPLHALGGNEFAVESWPASVHFETFDGVVRSLSVEEHQRFGQPPWPGGTYARVAERA